MAIEMIVKLSELAWMFAMGWTLVDDEARFKTEDGNYRITTEHLSEISRAVARAIGLKKTVIGKEAKLLISPREWDEIRGIEHPTCEGDVACLPFQPSVDLNAAFAAAEVVGLLDVSRIGCILYETDCLVNPWVVGEVDWEDAVLEADVSCAPTPALAICAAILKLKGDFQ